MSTQISYCDETWNPVVGCTPVTAGCDHCWAARLASGRLRNLPAYKGLARGGKWTGEVREVYSALLKPLRWKKPRTILISAMGDLFYLKVHFAFARAVLDTIKRTPQHRYLILTKRPEQMRLFLRTMQGAALPSNTWWGVSISCQADADAMIPPLLSCPVEHRWLSIEPMVGSVDASAFLSHGGEAGHTLHPEPCTLNPKKWVVCGGESGPGARPMHPDWPRSLRDQCQAAGVPFFFKQWGEWVDYWEQCEGYREDDYELPSDRPVAWWDPHGIPVSDPPEVLSHAEFERYQAVDRVGKKAAGRLLDGREHTEVPW